MRMGILNVSKLSRRIAQEEKGYNIIPEEYREKTLDQSIVHIFRDIGQATKISEAGLDEKNFNDNLDKLVNLASEYGLLHLLVYPSIAWVIASVAVFIVCAFGRKSY